MPAFGYIQPQVRLVLAHVRVETVLDKSLVVAIAT